MFIERRSLVPENQHPEIMVEVVEAGPASPEPNAPNEVISSASKGGIFHIHT